MKIAPRDIFNDANYYKNLAYLLEFMEKGVIQGLDFQCAETTVLNRPFAQIDDASGDLVSPYGAFSLAGSGENLTLVRPVNSRESFPVYFETEDYSVYDVFHEGPNPSLELGEICEPGVPSSTGGIDPADVMARSVALKCVAKLALLTVDKMTATANISFDNDMYDDVDVQFEKDGGYLDINSHQYFTQNQSPLYLRSPSRVSDSEPWPLEFSVDGRDYRPVYQNSGELSQEFTLISSIEGPECDIPQNHGQSVKPNQPQIR